MQVPCWHPASFPFLALNTATHSLSFIFFTLSLFFSHPVCISLTHSISLSLSLLLFYCYIPHLQFQSTKSVCCTVHLSRSGGGDGPLPFYATARRRPINALVVAGKHDDGRVLLHESHKTFYSGKSFRLADVFEQTITFVTRLSAIQRKRWLRRQRKEKNNFVRGTRQSNVYVPQHRINYQALHYFPHFRSFLYHSLTDKCIVV